jgi:hypothetical protein
MISTFDYVSERKEWEKKEKAIEAARTQCLVSYCREIKLVERCEEDMATVYGFLSRTAHLLDDEAFMAGAREEGRIWAQEYADASVLPTPQKLRIEAWTAPDAQLGAALVQDGFECVTAAGCIPIVLYGDGNMSKYRMLVGTSGQVTKTALASGILRGTLFQSSDHIKPRTQEELETAGHLPDARPPTSVGPEMATVANVGPSSSEGPRYKASLVARPAGGKRLHDLLGSSSLDCILTEIVEDEGPVNLPVVLARLRDVFGQSRILQQTQDGIKKQLDRLCSSETVVLTEDFYHLRGTEIVARYREPGTDVTRELENIAPAELQDALVQALRTQGPGQRDEIASQAAACLGYALKPERVAASSLGRRLVAEVGRLSSSGRIVEDDGTLRLTGSDMGLHGGAWTPTDEAEQAPNDQRTLRRSVD